jgi:hypothetical protein
MQVHQAADTLGRPQTSSLGRAVGVFAAHFMEMCAVMCIGGQVLTVAFFEGAALTGAPNLPQQQPAASILAVTASLTIAMAAWMAIRRHPLRHNLEMSLPTLAIGVVLSVAVGVGILPLAGSAGYEPLFGLVCGPACIAMLVVMLLRFDMYGGRVSHHQQVH